MTFLLIHRKCCVLFIYFTVGILWEKKSLVVKKQLFRHLILYLLLHYFGAVRLAVGEVLSVGQAVKYMKMHLKVQNVSPPLQFPEDVQ